MTDYELSRRHLLALGGSCAAGLALAGGSGTAHAAVGDEPYVMTANAVQGPPWLLNGTPMRGDITDGKAGAPLALSLTVRDAEGTGEPVPDARVELWHCDGEGHYSPPPPLPLPPPAVVPYAETMTDTESDAGSGAGSGTDPEILPGTGGEAFLRGFQVSGSKGRVAFTTIVPGWFRARAPHIHVRVHVPGYCHTGQLFFRDAVIERVRQQEPYRRIPGEGPTPLAEDPVYLGGEQGGLLTLEHVSGSRGYTARLTLGLAQG